MQHMHDHINLEYRRYYFADGLFGCKNGQKQFVIHI